MMYLNFAETPGEQRRRHLFGSALGIIVRFNINRYALTAVLAIFAIGAYAVAEHVMIGMKSQEVRFAQANAQSTRAEANRVRALKQSNAALENYAMLFNHASLTGNAWAVQVARIGDAIAGGAKSPTGVWVDSVRAADGLNQGWIVDGKAASSGRLAVAIQRLDRGKYLSSYPTWTAVDNVTGYHVDLFPENFQNTRPVR